MRGQPKRHSRNYPRRNGGNVIVFVSISFHNRNVLCTLGRLSVRSGFRLFCARLAVHYLAFYSILGGLIKQSLTATSALAVSACIIILGSFLNFVVFYKRSQRNNVKKPRSAYSRERPIRRQFLEFFFFLTLSSYSVWNISGSIDKLRVS